MNVVENIEVNLMGGKPKEGFAQGTRLAFEISEEVPGNWRRSIPAILNTLKEIGS